MEPRFNIGTQFIRQSRKHKYVETIIDILTTTNYAGEVKAIRYVAEHEFCGQMVVDSDICDTTVARGLLSN